MKLQTDKSKYVSKLWKEADRETKDRFTRDAATARRKHAELHPDYKFNSARWNEKSSKPYRLFRSWIIENGEANHLGSKASVARYTFKQWREANEETKDEFVRKANEVRKGRGHNRVKQ